MFCSIVLIWRITTTIIGRNVGLNLFSRKLSVSLHQKGFQLRSSRNIDTKLSSGTRCLSCGPSLYSFLPDFVYSNSACFNETVPL